MFLRTSLQDTLDSLTILVAALRLPNDYGGRRVRRFVARELQRRLDDLFAEIELTLIVSASIASAEQDSQRLPTCVTHRATVSIVDNR